MRYSGMSITAYSSGSTLLDEPLLAKARNIKYSSIYPGGYEQASFFLPRKITGPLKLKLNMRVKILYGLRLAWEGLVTNLVNDTAAGGTAVTCTGYFGQVLARRSIRKPWAETKMDDSVWYFTQMIDKFTASREGTSMRLLPKNAALVTNDTGAFKYTAPTGQTIKRITFDYDFAEPGQVWVFRLYNWTATNIEWSVTATGSGTQDITFATPSSLLSFQYYIGGNNTGVADGTYYGEVSNVVLYGETGSINLTEIAKDVRGAVAELSAYEGEIDSNTYSLVPFVADPMTFADILAEAASYGDASFNPWMYGVWGSDLGVDDKPVLFVEQFPGVLDHDYMIRLDQRQMMDTTFEQNLDNVRNWIAVSYRDVEGRTAWLTPDDVATHKDATSIAANGELQEWTSINTSSTSVVTNYARRFVLRRKDAQWVASSGLSITGHCMTKAGAVQPAALMRAGKRLRVGNYLNDLSGYGLTWMITRCEYDHDTRTAVAEVGRPDHLSTLLAGYERRWGAK